MSEDEKSTAERIKDLKRKDEDDARIDFKVYNMPVDLVQRFISRAKLYYDNEVWRVLKKADKLLHEEETSWRDKVNNRLDVLEGEIKKLRAILEEEQNLQEDENSNMKPTFGNDEKETN